MYLIFFAETPQLEATGASPCEHGRKSLEARAQAYPDTDRNIPHRKQAYTYGILKENA